MDTNALIDVFHERAVPVNGCQLSIRTSYPVNMTALFTMAHSTPAKMASSDNTAWMVRFPRVGMTSDDYTENRHGSDRPEPHPQ
ncbi:hypothetical protein N7447_011064 [Penicillium robsamsonii]|uniref:uncharacterized protein n=1 Tax=Penicillium robsamsonii TaxID=1792511 RepID=UPI00254778B8|nr:uncharacterized protein N7447_011064 [Penicillium robsamsonii]KAJ5807608.1 hypothetical protein N7447_011064 [Penicillium robsamsonii]